MGEIWLMFVGKRPTNFGYEPDDDDYKRARMFVGKRPMDVDLDEKRARMFVGKRLSHLSESLGLKVRRSVSRDQNAADAAAIVDDVINANAAIASDTQSNKNAARASSS